MIPSSPSASRLLCPLIMKCLLALTLMGHSQDRPFISEIVTIGNDSYRDEDEDTPDWLEIYNPTDAAVDLAGYHLTDDVADLVKWTFPSFQLPAGGSLVVFASDKDRALSGSEFHTNFKLSGSGEYLALIEPNGLTIASAFAPEFPAQAPGFSYGVEGPDPEGNRGYFDPPTPGMANGTLLSAPLIAPLISPACATFASNVEVTIAPAFVGGQVRYTTNGS
ncbi:MAG: hypothetical protein ACJAVK_002664, partial [Akkermansiaceae bacterium]